MISTRGLLHGVATALLVTAAGLTAHDAQAQVQIADVPLFLGGNAPPLNLLVMGRDHKLFYEAYNDASDLTGDGVPDVGYKPNEIDYFGYFDSFKCYTHTGGAGGRFVPTSTTPDKRCPGAFWSGDWLNYVTTARIDALRKVLYGGLRVVDSGTETVLQRSFIPQDAHSWGKDYASVARDGYDINDYTPLNAPGIGQVHMFANTTLLNTANPLLRVLPNVTGNRRIWNWVSIERPVAGSRLDHGGTGPSIGSPISGPITDYGVRVRVCMEAMPEDNCQAYPSGSLRPTGLLQDFGENDRMLFGLLTGSWDNNLRGGVLRRRVGSITEEINPETGQFTSTQGIIRSIDALRIVGFTTSHQYHGGFMFNRPMTNNDVFSDWGNPIAEMMYEGLRYYAGRGTPTPEFVAAPSAGKTSAGVTDAALGLSRASWDAPFDTHPVCSPGVMTVVSDINPSFDTQYVPGSAFSSFSGDLPGLNASALGQTIWSQEYGTTRQHFIGEVLGNRDGAPTAKPVSSFGNIRGLAPEEPTKDGGYYAASVAYHGLTTDLVPSASGTQNVSSYFVALASPLPRIEIPVAGRVVTLVPYAKSVGGFGINGAQGQFQPTNQIVDFYVETIANTTPANMNPAVNGGRPFGRFRINFEDAEQGADHDMDAIVNYEFRVTADGQVEVQLISEYAAGGVEQHMGYVVSGTTADGVYLEVRDCDTANPLGVNSHPSVVASCRGNSPTSVTRYFLSTPPGTSAGQCAASPLPAACNVDLPLFATRTFTPSGDAAATLLRDPLWYAAKYGGFVDSDGNDMPNLQSEWDREGDGNPDNYFLVTNALTLGQQLSRAFNLIISRVTSASAVATNSTRLDTETLIYQARFRSDDWTGQLLALRLSADGSLGAVQWDAAELLPAHQERQIFTLNANGVPTTFDWEGLSESQRDAIAQGDSETNARHRLDWLRGDQSREQSAGGMFRNRAVPLGDIVNSDPVFVGAQNFGYESLPPTAAGRDTYRAFFESKTDGNGRALQPTIYVGANDGMLHAFNAVSGEERFAYVPSTLIDDLHLLSRPDYQHRYFVDGDIFVGDAFLDGSWRQILVGATGAGGRTIFALDVTDPDNFGPENVLWEFTHEDDADLGYTIGQPSVVHMPSGQWAAVFANGYNGGSQRASLFVVDLQSGAAIRKINTGAGSALTPNGLSSPGLLASATRTITAAYAGDLQGNLWKFDLGSSNPSQWRVAYGSTTNPAPLFVARDRDGVRQPITAAIELGRHPDGGIMALFGTGRFLGNSDISDLDSAQVQSFYGIWDTAGSGPNTGAIVGSRETQLHARRIIDEVTAGNFEVRLTSRGDEVEPLRRGWFMDLVFPDDNIQGERVVSPAVLRAGRIIFPTLIPSPDPCSFGGSSWLMELEAFSGNRFTQAVLDLNEDGSLNGDDMVFIEIDGEMVAVPASGVRSREGIIRQPAIISAGAVEYKLASGTSGGVEVIRERGAFDRARGSWRQLR